MVDRRWFLFENIERRAGHDSRFDSFIERSFVDQTSAGAVDNAHALFHPRKSRSADDSPSFSSKRSMDRKNIRPRKNLVQRYRFDFKILGLFRGYERIMRYDLHAKSTRARSHSSADATQPDDAQGLALQLDADETLPFPLSLLDAAIGLRHVAGQRNQKGHRMFGGRDGVAVRRIHHHDAAR